MTSFPTATNAHYLMGALNASQSNTTSIEAPATLVVNPFKDASSAMTKAPALAVTHQLTTLRTTVPAKNVHISTKIVINAVVSHNASTASASSSTSTPVCASSALQPSPAALPASPALNALNASSNTFSKEGNASYAHQL